MLLERIGGRVEPAHVQVTPRRVIRESTSLNLTVLAGRIVGEAVVARAREDRPDAVFCVNDLLAVGALQTFVFRRQVVVPRRSRWWAMTASTSSVPPWWYR